MAAYIAVTLHLFRGTALLVSIFALAFTQLSVQLLFFLHLGREKNPRWNTFFLLSTLGVVLVVVVASIWIMNNLNYNMSPAQVMKYIKDQSSY
jgi:cytochrome o ubiquinol oxidase operon protein cyoD